MILENIFVVIACKNDGKNFDYPFASNPIAATLNPMSIDVTTLMTIHHKIPSKALSP